MNRLHEIAGYLLSQGCDDMAKAVIAAAEVEADLRARLKVEQARYDELRAAAAMLKRPGPALRALLGQTGFTEEDKP